MSIGYVGNVLTGIILVDEGIILADLAVSDIIEVIMALLPLEI